MNTDTGNGIVIGGSKHVDIEEDKAQLHNDMLSKDNDLFITLLLLLIFIRDVKGIVLG